MIKYLKTTNFGLPGIREFNLKPGLIFIYGPNGSGKSNITEAIHFLLAGTTALRSSKDNYAKDLEVRMIGDIFGHPFDATRGLSKAHATIGGEEVKGLAQVTKTFMKFLVDEKLFHHTFLCKQKECDLLAKATEGMRKQVLSKLLGVDIVDRCTQKLRLLRGSPPDMGGSLSQKRSELEGLKHLIAGFTVEDALTAEDARRKLKRAELYKEWLGRKDELNTSATKLTKTVNMLSGLEGLLKLTLRLGCKVCPVCLNKDISRQKIEEKLVLLSQKCAEYQRKVYNINTVLSSIPNEDIATLKRLAQSTTDKMFEDIKKASSLETEIKYLLSEIEQWTERKRQSDLRVALTEFRSWLLYGYSKYISQSATEVLLSYTNFGRLELTNDFELIVGGRPLDTYSGGQIDLIATLLRVVISRVLARLHFGGKDFTLVLDSAFDSLDDKNFDLATSALADRVRDFSQVILTSHHQLSLPCEQVIELKEV